MKFAIAWCLSFLGLLGLLSGSAQSQPLISPPPLSPPSPPSPLSYEAQRARVEKQRRQAQAQFDAAAVLCYQRFAVNDCLREARNVRRDLLADLRKQSLALRDAQARQKAQERLQGQ